MAAHGTREVPYATDLAAVGAEAREKKVAVLLMFGTPSCPFCLRLLDEFLIPMTRNPEYGGKVIMRQVELNGSRALRDFSGRATTHGRFARQQGIRFAPTVALFAPDGAPLGEPLVGLSTPDYYGAFLDRAIDEALAKLRTP